MESTDTCSFAAMGLSGAMLAVQPGEPYINVPCQALMRPAGVIFEKLEISAVFNFTIYLTKQCCLLFSASPRVEHSGAAACWGTHLTQPQALRSCVC